MLSIGGNSCRIKELLEVTVARSMWNYSACPEISVKCMYLVIASIWVQVL